MKFTEGMLVETTESYFETTGRKIVGEVVIINPTIEQPKVITMVRCLHQEGKVIPEQQNQIVLILTRDLKQQLQN